MGDCVTYKESTMKYMVAMLVGVVFSSSVIAKEPESYYRDVWCYGQSGQPEVVLEDRTRVDCLTEEFAVEADFASKWAESIGQSLYYANMTGRKPAVLLIVGPDHSRFVARFHNAAEGLGIRLYLIDQ